MENLSPTLQLLLAVRGALESGYSVRTGILNFLNKYPTQYSTQIFFRSQSFRELVSLWLLTIDQGQEAASFINSLHPCRRTLLLLLEKGLKGLPILPILIELENEIIKSCDEELNELIQKIPLLLLFPVLFLMFPAYLILLLGPLLESLLFNLSK